MTKVIGLTGGIGSGKSTVTNYLTQQQIPVIDMDIIARQLVEPGSDGLSKIVEYFGKDIIKSDGTLHRQQLREKVFNTPSDKQKLESILHPLIHAETLFKIEHLKKQNVHYIVVAIPLLVESILKGTRPGYLEDIWVVDCPVETQINRASQRDESSMAQIQKIIEQQATREQRLHYADQVITNNGSVEQLHQQIDTILAL